MRKRTFLASLASAIVSLTIALGATHAASAFSGGNPIWCGLWSGVNLDVSGQCRPNPNPPLPNPPLNPGFPAPPPAPAPPQAEIYAALGDSVAAGAGLPLASGASANDQQCARSPYGYPNLVATQTGMQLINASCSGAKVGDLFTDQNTAGGEVGPQLDAAFANGVPKLITVTAGANDAHWADFIRACYATTCGGTGYNAVASAYISAMKVKWHIAFNAIQNRSHGNPPEVIMTGYYHPFSPACASPQLTAAELAWLDSEWDNLNTALQDVASHYSFVKYIPVDFSGHDVCSSDPWVQAPTDLAPLHPTIKGQQVLANLVSTAL
ncbi:MAG TPA: SGNH/GDSL hydrolase family protein [Candidatus Saccharimonadales bacterium]